MASLDLSTGFTQIEIEALLATQKALLLKIISSLSESGSQLNYRSMRDCKEVIRACQEQLRIMAPATYGIPTMRCKQSAR